MAEDPENKRRKWSKTELRGFAAKELMHKYTPLWAFTLACVTASGAIAFIINKLFDIQ